MKRNWKKSSELEYRKYALEQATRVREDQRARDELRRHRLQLAFDTLTIGRPLFVVEPWTPL